MGDRRPPGLIRPHENKLAVLLRVLDGALIVAVLWAANRLYPQRWTESDTVVAALAVAAFVLVTEVTGLYRQWRGSPLHREATKVLSSWAMVAPALLAFGFVYKTTGTFSRQVGLTWFAATPAVLILWRLALRLALQELRRRGYNGRTVAILGATPGGFTLARTLLDQPWSGLHLMGLYDDRAEARCPTPTDLRDQRQGEVQELVRAARNGEVDLIYIALPLRAEARINRMLHELADTTATVYLLADFFAFDLLRAESGRVGDLPVVSLFESPFSELDACVKRLEDIVLGTIILGVSAIPMAAIAAAIKLTSRGQVFFRQRRYGLHGEEIRVLKFRTMTVCEDGANVPQARAGDARVTPVGAFLRRTSLDELPQFFHVLTGTMSIVGPRPHAVAHNELYRSQIRGYMLRHKVKPGITGWAQVNGWRGETDTLEKMQRRIDHDLEYIRRWRLVWDLQIILLTLVGTKVRRNAV
jgi:putative colanic acid biosynthesis UDP-glucose lipid carrier transferase